MEPTSPTAPLTLPPGTRRFVLKVANNQRVLLPFTAAIITITPERLQMLRALKEVLGVAQRAKADFRQIEYDDTTPKFIYRLPADFRSDEYDDEQRTEVGLNFDGDGGVTLMPRLRVYMNGVCWSSKYVKIDDGVPFITETLPWEMLGL